MTDPSHCSFCGRTRVAVRKLVAEGSAAICDVCVGVAHGRPVARGQRSLLPGAVTGPRAPACSFCGAPPGPSLGLFDGPGVAVCTDCIVLCEQLLGPAPAPTPPAPTPPAPAPPAPPARAPAAPTTPVARVAPVAPVWSETTSFALVFGPDRLEDCRPQLVTSTRVVLGSHAPVRVAGARPQHATIEAANDVWTVRAIDGAPVNVNGVRLRGDWTLSDGDRIHIGDQCVAFFSKDTEARSFGPQANGFTRARHYLKRAAEIAANDAAFLTRMKNFEEALANTERSAVIQKAIALMDAEKWGDALEALEHTLARFPRHATALHHKALCLFHLGRIPDAERAAFAAIDAAGPDEKMADSARRLLQQIAELGPKVLLGEAIDAMNEDRFAEAEKKITAALQTYPNDAALLLHLGICQAKRDQFPQARASLQAAGRHAEDPKLRQRANDLLGQVADMEQDAAASRLVDVAMAAMDAERWEEATQRFAALPRSTLESPDVKFMFCVARVRGAVRANAYGLALSNLLRAVETDLLDVIARGREQTRDAASNFLRQVRDLRGRAL